MRVQQIVAGFLTVAATTVLLVSCNRGDDSAQPPVLPPGMRTLPASNADAVPPAIPFDSATPLVLAAATSFWAHDTAAYTQGLLVSGDRILEGTGLEGHSEVRELRRESAAVLRHVALDASRFGEGIALQGDRLYQLTWKAERGLVYDATTLAPIDSFQYTGEGWGLTSDGRRLYMSDGSSTIRVVDPEGFRVERAFQVREGEHAVWMLNELEWIDGELWANVYRTGFIARIDPDNGRVLGWVDVQGLLSAAEREDVSSRGGLANGIAYDAARQRVLLTGKLWPKMFEIPLASLRPVNGTR